MERWIQGLYYYILKHKHKISELSISEIGDVYAMWELSGDVSVQRWIDGLQDK